ncbi:MAG: hypothetical protein DYG92_14395 [Leptolyngbya sp. PLA1]|nr:hypothetical protein [Leptolyngbya sp. PLA1]
MNPDQADAAWECMVKHSDLAVLSTHDLTMHYCQPSPTTCPPSPGSSNVCFRVYPDDAPVPGTPGLPAVPSGGADSECVMRDALSLPACATTLTDDRGWVQVALADIAPMSPFGWLNEGHTFIRTVDGQPVETPGYAHCYGYNSGVAIQTCGNNVWVRTAADVVSAGAARAFDFALPCPAEPGVPPNAPCATAFQHWDAVAAEVFYLANVWHDRMYLLGFEEQAGNFQATNFGRGGNPASDPLEIVVNGSPDRDYGNARFNRGQSEDGAPYVVNFSVMPMLGEVTPSRPAALDKTVVFHELTHTMIARLGVGSMEAQQAAGMHEGTADFFAIAITASPADDYAATYPVFSWPNRAFGAGYVSHYYFGARRYPYSQDMGEINPLTYGFIDPDEANNFPYPDDDIPRNPTRLNVARSELHAIGEVWASALLDARYRLSQEPSVGQGANDVLMQLVVDGLKLNPGQPNFLQARDAILQADLLRHGGLHHPSLWWAFARRGMGWGASSPANGGARNVVQSTSATPATNLEVSFFFPDDPPLAIDTCGPTSFDAMIVGVAQPLTSVEVVLHGTGLPTIDAGLPSSVAALGGGTYRVSVGPGLCRQAWEVTLRAGPAPGSPPYRESHPMLFVAGILGNVPGFPVTMEVDDSGSQDPWTSGMTPPWVPSAPANAGRWERVDPIGGNVQPARDATPGGGYQCWVTQNRINLTSTGVLLDDVDSDGDGAWLRSPEWVLNTQTTGVLEFRQWYASSGTGAAADVQWRVDVLRDGDVVQSRAYLPLDVTGLAWRLQRVPFGTGTTSGAGHRARFHVFDQLPEDTAVEGGLDDVVVYQIVGCADCCDADLNRDSNRDQDDVTYLINAVATGESPAGSDPDFNRDGNVDQQDIIDLIDYVGGAPCPL